MSSSPLSSAFVACALVFAACEKRSPVAELRPALGGDPPNILLISIDSLRADHLGCYGYERATSPAIDRLATQGTLFEVMVSSTSWTLPSHAAMFTALPDSVHGAVRTDTPLSDERITLAEALRSCGYRTAGFYSGPYLDPHFGLAQGFEEYTSCASYEVESEVELLNKRARMTGLPPNQGRAHELSHEDVTSPRILEEVGAWLRENREEPFFLFVHMWDVHYGYLAPPPFDTMFDDDYEGKLDGRNLGPLLVTRRKDVADRDLVHLVALYDAEIAWTDMHVGEILGVLDEVGRDEDTAVIVTADHGEEFFDHGQYGHRKTLYDESLRVPFIVRYPGRVPAGLRVPAMVRMVDVAPTILDLVGSRDLPDVMGRSFLDLMERADARRSGKVFAVSELARSGYTLFCVRCDDWKVIAKREEGKPIGLWNLREDPTEKRNLLGADGELRREASTALRKMRGYLDGLSTRHRVGATSEASLPEDVERALKSHGYVGDGDDS